MSRIVDIAPLHATFRTRVNRVITELGREGIPLRLYETVRTPWRQAELYARGRSVPGTTKATNAKAWRSFHQYGLAVDMVFNVGGQWTWSEPAPGMWERYQEIARKFGLNVLSFEKPHVELPWSIDDARRGLYPPDGGTEWEAWLGAQIEQWGQYDRDAAGTHHPGAPPPFDIDHRPEMTT